MRKSPFFKKKNGTEIISALIGGFQACAQAAGVNSEKFSVRLRNCAFFS
jgi:hypothetical protein